MAGKTKILKFFHTDTHTHTEYGCYMGAKANRFFWFWLCRNLNKKNVNANMMCFMSGSSGIVNSEKLILTTTMIT